MVPRGVEVSPQPQQALDVLQHAQLRQSPGPLDAVLGDACRVTRSQLAHPPPRRPGGAGLTAAGHGCLEAVQRLFILTQVVGHVPVSVDSQEVGTTAGRWTGRWPRGPSQRPAVCKALGLELGHRGQRRKGPGPRCHGPCPHARWCPAAVSTCVSRFLGPVCPREGAQWASLPAWGGWWCRDSGGPREQVWEEEHPAEPSQGTQPEWEGPRAQGGARCGDQGLGLGAALCTTPEAPGPLTPTYTHTHM